MTSSQQPQTASVDRFREELARWTDGESVDLVAAAHTLRTALDDGAEASEVAGVASLARHLTAAANQMPRATAVTHNQQALDALDRLLTVIAEGFRPLTGNELAAAEVIASVKDELLGLEAELEEREQMLREAADSVDLAAIQRLRPMVEVEGPGRIGECRLRLFDAEIARARLPIPAAQDVAAAKAAEAESAATKVASLTDQLRKATDGHATAERRARQADAEVDRLVRELETLESRRENEAAEYKSAQRQRVLRLAGLDEPVPAAR